jgi:uncharacterized membrane protein
MLLFALLYYATAIGNHYFFRSAAFDYGTYNFAFWDYAHFHVSKCPVYYKENMSFLQDHFSLTLMYFVPVYWLLNWLTGTYTLLLIQISMILVGGWATYKLAILKTADEWLGIGALLYYFLLQGHFSAFVGDCNVAVISASFIPMFLYFFESKKYIVAAIIFLLAILSRENMPLWFISLMPIVMLWHRKERKIIIACTAYILVSFLYFVLLFKVIIPHLETPDKKYSLFNYSALGLSPFDAFKYVLHHPFNTVKMLFTNTTGDASYNNVKKEFYLVYLISGGFILFLRPQYFIWFIPLLAQKMLNDETGRWSIEWHYAIEVVTMLPIAVFIILSSLKNKWLRYSISLIVCILTFGVTWNKMNAKNHALPFSPTVKENIFDTAFFKPACTVKEVNTALSLIPPDAIVSASASILPHLAQRKAIYVFPKTHDDLYGDAQYITAFSYFEYGDPTVNNNQYNNAFYKYLLSPEWTILSYSKTFLLLKKQPRPVIYKATDSIFCNNETSSADNMHLIASNGSLVFSKGTRDSSKTRLGKYSCMLTENNPYGMILNDSTLNQGTIVAATIWRYSGNKKGVLVVSDGKNLYHASEESEITDPLGWEKLLVYATVPVNHSKLSFYAWNNGNSPVWFDDLKIIIYPSIPYTVHF